MGVFKSINETVANQEIKRVQYKYVEQSMWPFFEEWKEFRLENYAQFVESVEKFKKAVKTRAINGKMLYTLYQSLVIAESKCKLEFSRNHFKKEREKVEKILNQMRTLSQSLRDKNYLRYSDDVAGRRVYLFEAKAYNNLLITLQPEVQTHVEIKNLINSEIKLYDFCKKYKNLFESGKVDIKYIDADFVNNLAYFSRLPAKIDKKNATALEACKMCKSLIPGSIDSLKTLFYSEVDTCNEYEPSRFKDIMKKYEEIKSAYQMLKTLNGVDADISKVYTFQTNRYQKTKYGDELYGKILRQLREALDTRECADDKARRLHEIENNMNYLKQQYNYEFSNYVNKELADCKDTIERLRKLEYEREQEKLREEAERKAREEAAAKKAREKQEKQRERDEELEAEVQEKKEEFERGFNNQLYGSQYGKGYSLESARRDLDSIRRDGIYTYGEIEKFEDELKKAEDKYEADKLSEEISFALSNATTTEDLDKIDGMIDNLSKITKDNVSHFTYVSGSKRYDIEKSEREREEREREL